MVTEQQLRAFADDHSSKLGSPVNPRYLAGPGDPRHVTHSVRAAGWTLDSDPLHPTITMISPDREHRLTVDPDPGLPRHWWQIGSLDGPRWYATFSGDTPVEIVAALTDALIRPVPEESALSVVDILSDRDWDYSVDERGGHKLLSPDGITMAELYVSRVSGVRGWNIDAARHHGPYGPEDRLWQAHLHHATPSHLVVAVARALVDPTPVLRSRWAIPSGQGQHLSVGAEFPIGEAVVAEHKKRLAQARRLRPKKAPGASPAPPVVPATSRHAPSR